MHKTSDDAADMAMYVGGAFFVTLGLWPVLGWHAGLLVAGVIALGLTRRG